MGQELHQSTGSTVDRAEAGLDGEASAGAWRGRASGLGCWHQEGVSGPGSISEGHSPRLGGCDEQDGEIQVGSKVLSWDPLENGGAVF